MVFEIEVMQKLLVFECFSFVVLMEYRGRIVSVCKKFGGLSFPYLRQGGVQYFEEVLNVNRSEWLRNVSHKLPKR